MKPRLEVAPLTNWDLTIWRRMSIWAARRGQLLPHIVYYAADRRDADLMLLAQQYRGAPALIMRTAAPFSEEIDIRGGIQWMSYEV